MKHLFNENMTSDQAHTGFLIEFQRLNSDYQRVMGVIKLRESALEGRPMLTEHEIPLDINGLRSECEAHRLVDVLVIDAVFPHYGEITKAYTYMGPEGATVAMDGGSALLYEASYEDYWIAFRTEQPGEECSTS